MLKIHEILFTIDIKDGREAPYKPGNGIYIIQI